MGDVSERIEKLSKLQAAGSITPNEFVALKARIIEEETGYISSPATATQAVPIDSDKSRSVSSLSIALISVFLTLGLARACLH